MKPHQIMFLDAREYEDFKTWLNSMDYFPIVSATIPEMYGEYGDHVAYYESYTGKYASSGFRVVEKTHGNNNRVTYYAKLDRVKCYLLNKLGVTYQEFVSRYGYAIYANGQVNIR